MTADPEDQGERNGRRFEVAVRDGMREGQHLAIAIRFWGPGQHGIASGDAHHFTRREHARAAGARWLDDGLR